MCGAGQNVRMLESQQQQQSSRSKSETLKDRRRVARPTEPPPRLRSYSVCRSSRPGKRGNGGGAGARKRPTRSYAPPQPAFGFLPRPDTRRPGGRAASGLGRVLHPRMLIPDQPDPARPAPLPSHPAAGIPIRFFSVSDSGPRAGAAKAAASKNDRVSEAGRGGAGRAGLGAGPPDTHRTINNLPPMTRPLQPPPGPAWARLAGRRDVLRWSA